LILAKTSRFLFVFDVNGLPIRKMEWEEIRRWFGFKTRDGFDFVACQADDFSCYYFEAARPESRVPMEYGGRDLVGMLYNKGDDSIAYVFETGKVFVQALPEPKD
jgi:hypothetical protein